MPLKILVVAATESEADSLRRIPDLKPSTDNFMLGKSEISLLITGVGSIATSWAMTKWLSSHTVPDLVINIGIAGSYNDEIVIGEVVVPVTDCFADAGIETKEGFMTLSEAGIADPDRRPFKNGRLVCENKYVMVAKQSIRSVSAITVNCASGSEATIEKMRNKYNPDIETMEGATFFYICSGENIPFLALRSVSNMVEPRNRENWDIHLALNNLSEKLNDFLLMAGL